MKDNEETKNGTIVGILTPILDGLHLLMESIKVHKEVAELRNKITELEILKLNKKVDSIEDKLKTRNHEDSNPRSLL